MRSHHVRLSFLAVIIALTAASAQGATFLCVGDSLTFGDGGTPTSGYLGPLAAYLDSVGQPATMLNAGISAENTDELLARLGSTMLSRSSDFVLVMTGTNDLTFWIRPSPDLTPAVTDSNLDDIISAIRSAGRTPILATVPPRLSGDSIDPSGALTSQLNGIIRAVASREGVTLAEVNGNFSGLTNEFTYEDSLHPTTIMYPLISEAFAAAITSTPISSIDLTGPLPVDISPSPFSSGNPVNTNVRIGVKDNRNSIDATNAVMTIDGVSVLPQIDTSRPGEVHFIYNFPADLGFNQRVAVSFVVSDLATPPRGTSLVYNFDVSEGNGTGGDIDGSGRVDGLDLVILAAAFGTSIGNPGFVIQADIDGSGTVDGLDLTFLVTKFGSRP